MQNRDHRNTRFTQLSQGTKQCATGAKAFYCVVHQIATGALHQMDKG